MSQPGTTLYNTAVISPTLSVCRVPGCGQMGQPWTTPTGYRVSLMVVHVKIVFSSTLIQMNLYQTSGMMSPVAGQSTMFVRYNRHLAFTISL